MAKSNPKSVEELLAEAYELLDQGEYQKADRKFNAILKEDKENAAAYFGKAEASVGVPKLSLIDVSKLYRDAIRLDPANPEYYLAYGAFCLENGLLKQAVEQYEKAAELDPESAPLFFNDLSFGYLINGVEFLERQLNITEEDIKRDAVLLKLRALDLDKESGSKILDELDEEGMFGPEGPGHIDEDTSKEIEKLAKVPEAKEILGYIKHEPYNPFNYLALAQCAFDQGLFRAAEVHYLKSIDLDPDAAREYYNDLAINYYMSAMARLGAEGAAFTKDDVLKRALYYSLRAFRINKRSIIEMLKK